MTNDEIEKKWKATEEMLKVDYENEFHEKNELMIADPKAVVKSYLHGAITQLRLLDYHDEDYRVPWTRKQFMWVLADPVGISKQKQAEQWKHECFAMTNKFRGVTA